jgi:hypothetical protein
VDPRNLTRPARRGTRHSRKAGRTDGKGHTMVRTSRARASASHMVAAASISLLAGLLCCGAPGQAGAQTLDADTRALLDFKAAGDANGDLSSWDLAVNSPCGAGWNDYDSGWLHVKCSAPGGRVARVILRVLPGLSGSAATLADCTALTHLALSGCSAVSGSVESLAACTQLILLDARDTQLSGSIEPLTACQSLATLYLMGSHVHGDATVLSSGVPGLGGWGGGPGDYSHCAAWSGTCIAGTLVVDPTTYAGLTVAECCDVFCSGNPNAADDHNCTRGLLVANSATTLGTSDADCCFLCPVGQRETPGGCVDCDAGFSTFTPGASTCTQCASGKEAASPGSRCTECEDGKMSASDPDDPTSTVTCTVCPYPRRCTAGLCKVGTAGRGCAYCDTTCPGPGCLADRYFQVAVSCFPCPEGMNAVFAILLAVATVGLIYGLWIVTTVKTDVSKHNAKELATDDADEKAEAVNEFLKAGSRVSDTAIFL